MKNNIWILLVACSLQVLCLHTAHAATVAAKVDCNCHCKSTGPEGDKEFESYTQQCGNKYKYDKAPSKNPEQMPSSQACTAKADSLNQKPCANCAVDKDHPENFTCEVKTTAKCGGWAKGDVISQGKWECKSSPSVASTPPTGSPAPSPGAPARSPT